MTTIDSLMTEAIPAPGLYQSFNGKILLGGQELIRVSNAYIRVSVGVAKYDEVGTRYGTPYRRETRITVSITRAFVNFYEFALGMGLEPSADYAPGVEYVGDNLTKLLENFTAYFPATKKLGLNSDRPPNLYPIKTDAIFEVNPDGVIVSKEQSVSVQDVKSTNLVSQLQSMLVEGLLIDTNQISIGSAGDIITSGSVELMAEKAKWILGA